MAVVLRDVPDRSRPGNRPWLTGALLVAMLSVFILAPNPDALAWSAGALADGEPWRGLTGHWMHSDTAHLAWNSLALAIIGTLIERHSRLLLVGSLAAGHLAVNGWLMSPAAGLKLYCGLSGVLHTLLVSALVLEGRHGSRRLALLAGLLCLAKLGTELLTGGAVITQTRWPAAPPAHAAGVLGGALPVLALFLHTWLRKLLHPVRPIGKRWSVPMSSIAYSSLRGAAERPRHNQGDPP